MSRRSDLVLYHAGCVDGFASAYAASKALPEDTEFVAVSYRAEPPSLDDVRDRSVYVLDFNYSPEVIESWADAKRILILDHHRTMAKAWGYDGDHVFSIRPFKNAEVRYNPYLSGAGMSWYHFHPSTPTPNLILYVQDRDLWRFQMPHSREVNAYIASVPFDFSKWATLEAELKQIGSAVRTGKALLSNIERQVEYITGHAMLGEMFGHPVVVCNSPVLQSDVGQRLYDQYPDRIAVIWYYSPARNQIIYSLRSQSQVDASELAQKLGGGGHKNAAGAYVSAANLNELLGVLPQGS